MYELTSYQTDIWIDQYLNPDIPIYNIGGYSKFLGKVNSEAFKKAVDILIRDNDALRIIFKQDGEKPYIEVLPELEYELEFYDFTKFPKDYCKKWMENEFEQPFQLNGNRLFKVALLQADEDLYYFFFSAHHIIVDGWGFSLIHKYVIENYNSIIRGESAPQRITGSYTDFISHNKDYMRSKAHERDVAFWKSRFPSYPESFLFTKIDYLEKESFESQRKTLTIPRTFFNKLNNYSEENGCSIFHLFLGALAVYFSKVNEKNEIVIGAPILNRGTRKFKSTVGHFTNILPIKIQIEENINFIELMKQIKSDLFQSYKHLQLSTGEITRGIGEVAVRNNLFDIVLSYEKQDYENSLDNCTVDTLTVKPKYAKNALLIYIREFTSTEDVRIDFDYQLHVFNNNYTIDTVLNYFEFLLHEIIDNPSKCIIDLNIISNKEKKELFQKINSNYREYKGVKTIHRLFEEQVRKTPDRTALITHNHTMSYRDLDVKANRFANAIHSEIADLQPGDNVSQTGKLNNPVIGVYVKRSKDMIALLLGILKSGAAYLPIDPTYPPDRIKYVLEDSGAQVLVSQDNMYEKVEFDGLCLDMDKLKKKNPDTQYLLPKILENDLAYIIYTSGSTGMPKGVMVEHETVVNFLHGAYESIDFTESMTMLALTTISFDPSILEIFLPLVKGMKVVICSEDDQKNPEQLAEIAMYTNADVLQTTPSRLQYIMNSNKSASFLKQLKLILIGGESTPSELLKDLKACSNAAIYNMYGPTECTVWSTCKEITDNHLKNIGKPFANIRAYVLDKNKKQKPIGVPGELYLSGNGITRGYINKELTNKMFIPDPFIPGSTMYRTGDLVQLLSNGDMEFIGRNDKQVKIRGHRIEIDEIENKLLQHEAADMAAVIAKGTLTNKYLCAFIVLNKPTSIESLKEYLMSQLPFYMVPAYILELDELPATHSGKIDRKKLSDIELNPVNINSYEKPAKRLEKEIAEIWREILEIPYVGVNDNFFEIGGNSITLIKMYSKIDERYPGIMDITALFSLPNIKEIARFIERKTSNSQKELDTKESSHAHSLLKKRHSNEQYNLEEKASMTDIAVIGMSLKFPNADSPEEFWENLKGGVDSVREISDLRKMDAKNQAEFIYPENTEIHFKEAAYLNEIDKFDYKFFNFTPKEASLMDPNQRLFLETAWSTIEDAGYNVRSLAGSSTGVYLGFSDDSDISYRRLIKSMESESINIAIPGNINSIIASGIAYQLDLKGPSMVIDTACSSSLVAVHTACQAIRNGDCHMALAGGIKLYVMPAVTGSEGDIGIFSSDGRTKAFDDRSDGTGLGEGVGVLLLKPLAKALNDGDHIYTVIKGSAVNQDGNSLGITAPNVDAQTDVILKAWENAGIDPESITYIEAHGTGTKLGDPIEINGIENAFRKYTNKKQFCGIGAVKTNIGHLDAAAGIAGLIKAILVMQNGELPKNLHYNKLNSMLSLENSPLYILDKHIKWDSNTPKRCGISSFGLSGTNCHMVLEEAPVSVLKTSCDVPRILALSANDDESLMKLVEQYIMLLTSDKTIDLDRVCYTANTGREQYSSRFVVAFSNRIDLIEKLKDVLHQGVSDRRYQEVIGNEEVAVITDVIGTTGYSEQNIQEQSKFANSLLYNLAERNPINIESTVSEICKLFIQGVNIDWGILYQNNNLKKVSLPSYNFKRDRCWIKPVYIGSAPTVNTKKHVTSIYNARPIIKGEDQTTLNELDLKITDVIAQTLGFNEIDVTEDLFEMGMDSIFALDIVNKIEKELFISLDISDIFSYTNILELSRYIQAVYLNNRGHAYKIIQPTNQDNKLPDNCYACSSAQKRLYALSSLENTLIAYNIPSALLIDGVINKDELEKTFKTLISRHEPLRTSFEFYNGEIVQHIHDHVDFSIKYSDIHNLKDTKDLELSALINNFIQPFDLSKAPLVRGELFNLPNGKQLLLFDIHHIISDGTTNNILINEVGRLLSNKTLNNVPLQYKDFATWQNKRLKSGDMKKEEDFCINMFNDAVPVLDMRTDYPRPPFQSFEGDVVFFKVDKHLFQAINNLALNTKSTIYMLLLSSFNILLSKYSGQEDIIIGTPVSGRTHQDISPMVGMFVNTLPIRNQPKGELTYLQFLDQLKANVVQSFENQDYPFEELVSKLNLGKDTSRNPLFDVVFALQSMSNRDIEIGGIKAFPLDFQNKVSKFDFSLIAEEVNGEILFNMEYSTKLFRRESIERMTQHYVNILRQIVDTPDITVADITMLSSEEKNLILNDFNNTDAEFPCYKTLNSLFEEQASLTPEKIAVVFKDETLTYEELNRRACLLGAVLTEKGVKPGKLVAIMAERSVEMIIGILAIQKVGGAFLPIDPDQPHERVKYILEDSEAAILLTQAHLRYIVNYSGQIISLDDSKSYKGVPVSQPDLNTPQSLAYVIYTSGSTGKPKGTMLKHEGLINLIHYFTQYVGISSNDRMLQFGSYSFDASVWEIFTALLNGASLYIVPKEIINNYLLFEEYLEENQITIGLLPPAYLKDIDFNKLMKFRYLLTGGDEAPVNVVNKLKDKICYLNAYGPSEDTVITTIWESEKHSENYPIIPIGKPISNHRIYITDKNLNLQPVGVTGELCISGVGLSKGYINRAEITSEKFIDNPFVVKNSAGHHNMMYRSGDLARWLPDGNIEYLGRIDNQVKVRGFRVELGEIEKKLLEKPEILDAVVIDQKDNHGSIYLCAFLVSSNKLSTKDLRNYLSVTLPDYMIPSFFIYMDSIPLNKSGKVDKNALLEINTHVVSEIEYAAPTNETEEILVKVWSEVLGNKGIGINHNFFLSGGESIKAIRIQAQLHKHGMEIDVKELYKKPTIKELSPYVKMEKRNIDQSLVTGESGYTPIQEWFFKHNFDDIHFWNQAVIVYKQTGFDSDIVQKAIYNLMKHHDYLRAAYTFTDDRVVTNIRGMEEKLFDLVIIHIDDNENHSDVISQNGYELQSNLDITKGPLLKAIIFKSSVGDHLMISAHHLVVDNVSWRIILEDMATAMLQLEEGKEVQLNPKTDSFKDWTKKLSDYAKTEELLGEFKYWKQIEQMQVKPFPKDAYVERSLAGNTDLLEWCLSKKETTNLLRHTNNAYQTELSDILLTALGLGLKEFSGINENVIMMDAHGREEIIDDINITRTIGWFTSQYPIVLKMEDTDNLEIHILGVKNMLREVPNKGIGYGILRYLTPSHMINDFKFRLVPDISFNFLGQFDHDINTSAFEFSPNSGSVDNNQNSGGHLFISQTISPKGHRTEKILFVGFIEGGRIHILTSFDKLMFERQTIEAINNCFRENLIRIIKHCSNGTKQTIKE